MGVGAELPEKQVKSGPSELKLKNKMLGKKREREELNQSDAANVPAPEDDEEESRSKVIQKKPRLDPFAPNKKKGKGLNVPTMAPPRKLAGTPPAFETKPEREKGTAVFAMDEDAPGPSSSKNVLNNASTSKQVLAISPRKSLTNSWRSRLTLGTDESDDEEEKQPVTRNVAAIPKPAPGLPPILNLHCPPVTRDDAEPSPKRKRRKRKKKRRTGGEAGVAGGLQTPVG